MVILPIAEEAAAALTAMALALAAKDRLAGVCLNDIGPEIAPEGLAAIRSYIGVAPKEKLSSMLEAQLS